MGEQVGSTWQLQLAMKSPFMAEEDKGKVRTYVKDVKT